jgi:hypothetical protein
MACPEEMAAGWWPVTHGLIATQRPENEELD